MTHSYVWVQWNKHKRIYDAVLGGSMALYLATFVGVATLSFPADQRVDPPILLMRALGTLAIIMLHVVLCIGPLARLTPRVAPLLYNRRHLGVSLFLVALAHAIIALGYYGGFGVRNPASALFDGYAAATSFASVSGFPFEVLGLGALLILFVMAATSHDFWLANLGHRFWKSLHMLVYAAYALLIGHVALGALQGETSPVYAVLLGAGVALVASLHIIAGVRERRRDANGLAVTDANGATASTSASPEWVDVCEFDQIEEGRAKLVCLRERERVAIFKHKGALHAMSNVCAHQGGPLGEGAIIDGCVTCPWHGYQYLPESGSSPPPFTEKVPTYEVRVMGSRVQLNPSANAPGTPTQGARP